ncbi:Transcription factor PIF1 [Platanthera zijinensis]|uniref:Transcription factor PIF1 n=1 Tax=Platanthera zijinensis TaxID=2320716 RepID=A0AAP0BLJ7_9ASPA
MIEFLWKDGQLVLHNQTSSSSPATIDETNQPQKAEDVSKSGSFLIGNFMNMNQVDETALWFQNSSDNSLESEFEEFFTSNNDRVIEDFLLGSPQNCRPEMAFDPMISASSGGSVCSFRGAEKQTTANHGHKRKERVMQDSEHHIENVEQKSLEASKQAQKTAPSCRNRAAELHNLSERKRRDRINEKMKALQDLIPHHYKSDKASMLEEAIGYLKSLQLQLQILWMGGGMAPMVFPGAQQYIPVQNPVQLPGATLLNPFMPPFSAPNMPMVFPSPQISPYPNQMPNVRLPEPFPRYFSLPGMQKQTQVQAMCTYGSQLMQHNQTFILIRNGNLLF